VEAPHFYANAFPDSLVGKVFQSPADFPGGKAGDVLTLRVYCLWSALYRRLTAMTCLNLARRFPFKLLQISRLRPTVIRMRLLTTEAQLVTVGGAKTNRAFSWQITPRVLTDAMAKGGEVAKRAFEAMMTMKKIDVAKIKDAIGQ
jgi:predicted 3-demethylubiquinone-9 3-methyltransferase (glyoxalase superfamily)